MISRPSTPHSGELIGNNWPEIDETALASLGLAIVQAGAGAQTAETKTYDDGRNYYNLLPEGFEAQVTATFRVGGMASDLAGWLGKGGAEADVTASSVMMTKIFIAIDVAAAEAIIAAKESEIAALQATSLRPEVREQRIQQLRNEIKQTIDNGKKEIESLYNGIYTPTTPAAPGLIPLTYRGQPPAGTGAATSGAGGGAPMQGPGGALKVSPAGSGDSTGSGGAVKPQYDSTTPPGQKPASEAAQNGTKPGEAVKPQSQPAGDVQPGGSQTKAASQEPGKLGNVSSQQPQVAVPPVSSPAPSSGGGSGSGGVGGGVPKMTGFSPPSTSLPSSGLSGGVLPGGGSGLAGSGGGLPGGGAGTPSAAAPGPAQQFLSGAAQSFASQAPSASNAAAAAQPFRPPPESTIQAGPPQAAPPPAAAAQQPVVAPAQSGAAALPAVGPQPAGAVPLAPPPPAGVPNAPAPPPATVPGGTGAVGVAGGPTSGASPAMPSPPSVMNLGAHNAALKAARMGSHTTGDVLSSTPEFAAATALVAALNDPVFGVVCEWACAVFQQPGREPRFVVASREGLSWIPSGVYMPDGVTVASLDDRVDYSIRKLWRGLKPPARVLSHYARAIGEEPIIVVARNYLGLAGLFSRRTVVVADESTVDPNPLRNPAGRHRLEVASPEGWWPQVQTIPEAEIAERIRGVAALVAESHNETFGVEPLRTTVVEQIGRSGGKAVWSAVEEQMHTVRSELMTAPIAAPEPLVDGWNDWMVAAERLLRGWETLWLAQRAPTRVTLADMTYAAVAATM